MYSEYILKYFHVHMEWILFRQSTMLHFYIFSPRTWRTKCCHREYEIRSIQLVAICNTVTRCRFVHKMCNCLHLLAETNYNAQTMLKCGSVNGPHQKRMCCNMHVRMCCYTLCYSVSNKLNSCFCLQCCFALSSSCQKCFCYCEA